MRTPRRVDGFRGQRRWEWRGSYWVAECCIVGCTNLIGQGQPICVSCSFDGERIISPEWWVWFWRNPTAERKQKLLAAHFEEDAFEVIR